jgi:hypothetical protein
LRSLGGDFSKVMTGQPQEFLHLTFSCSGARPRFVSGVAHWTQGVQVACAGINLSLLGPVTAARLGVCYRSRAALDNELLPDQPQQSID